MRPGEGVWGRRGGYARPVCGRAMCGEGLGLAGDVGGFEGMGGGCRTSEGDMGVWCGAGLLRRLFCGRNGTCCGAALQGWPGDKCHLSLARSVPPTPLCLHTAVSCCSPPHPMPAPQGLQASLPALPT